MLELLLGTQKSPSLVMPRDYEALPLCFPSISLLSPHIMALFLCPLTLAAHHALTVFKLLSLSPVLDLNRDSFLGFVFRQRLHLILALWPYTHSHRSGEAVYV